MGFGSLLSDFNSKEEQGDFGEFKVKNKLLKIKDKLEGFYLLRDVYVEYKDSVSQIDHILICSSGIFVIETKAVSGKVYGDIYLPKWNSYIYGNKTIFPNPIVQNIYHIDALKNFLGEGLPYYSIIVLSENNKPLNMPDNVVNLRELQNYLLATTSKKELEQEEIECLKAKLDVLVKEKNVLRQKHREQRKK